LNKKGEKMTKEKSKKRGRPRIDEKAREVISTYLPSDIVKKVKDKAEKSGKSVSEEISDMIQNNVGRENEAKQD